MFFCGFSPAKIHFEFTYTTNAFQDESSDLLNSKGYEHSFLLFLDVEIWSEGDLVLKMDSLWV